MVNRLRLYIVNLKDEPAQKKTVATYIFFFLNFLFLERAITRAYKPAFPLKLRRP